MKPQTIAVLDDEPPMCRALRRLLLAAGYYVETYELGEEFLADLEVHPVNCLVLDLHMPDMDGFEVLATLAKRPTKTPVIVLTARADPEIAETVRGLGASALVAKPVDESTLLTAIENACRDAETTPLPLSDLSSSDIDSL